MRLNFFLILSFVVLNVVVFNSCTKENIIGGDDAENTFSQQDHLMMATITTKKAKTFNTLFTRYGNGWTGGDATYSIPLPDGRVVWLFGDSFLDTVYADRSRPASGLIRNVFCVQSGSSLTTRVTGTIDAPQAFVNTPDPANGWYWPGDGTVIDGNLYVFMAYFIRTGAGAFDFSYQYTDLVKFSLPSITELSRTTVSSNPNTLFGAAVLEDATYIYIYGSESVPLTKYCHVARVPKTNIYAAWEYFNALTSVWQTTPPGTAGRLKKSGGSLNVDVSQQFSVHYDAAAAKYRLLTQEGFLGPAIYSYEALSPTGPWKFKTLTYTTPETGGDVFTYNAFVHPEFTTPDGYVLMSYNINTMNFFDLFSNADLYRPKFVWVKYM